MCFSDDNDDANLQQILFCFSVTLSDFEENAPHIGTLKEDEDCTLTLLFTDTFIIILIFLQTFLAITQQSYCKK